MGGMKSYLILQFTERRHLTAAPESVSIKKRGEVQLELRDDLSPTSDAQRSQVPLHTTFRQSARAAC